MRRILFFLLILAGSTACAGSRTALPPPRDADLYPNAGSIAGLTVAVDEISDPDRMRRYFGTDLTGENILPVNIIISNHGEDRFLVKPADVLLLEGNEVVDPVPVDTVQKVIKGGLPADLTMQEKVVAPQETYRPFLFFRVKQKDGLYGKVERFFTGRLTMRIVVTDQESGERIHFGPYSLSGF